MSEMTVFTIGHSTLAPEAFAALLKQYHITCVVDVRSVPYSRRVPHFNRESLRAFLRTYGVRYLHMPDEFGARKNTPELLDTQNRVDFDLVRQSSAFRLGLDRLRKGLEQGFRITLMCSEADPFDCHRFSMIAYQLVEEGWQVKHILRDGTLIDNAVLEERLLKQYWPQDAQPGFFDVPKSFRVRIEEAYRSRGREIAYSPTEVTQ